MIDTLYEPFSTRWSITGSVYIMSDPHFGDSDCKLMDENWVSPDEQVKLINSLCHKNDTFICLGDVGDTSYIAKLDAGHKVLIKGNHDKGDSLYHRQFTLSELHIMDDEPTPQESIDVLYKVARDTKTNKNSASNVYTWTHKRTDNHVVTHYRLTVDNGLFDEIFDGPLFISDRIVLSHAPIDFGNYNNCFFNIHGHEHTPINRDYHLNVAANVCRYTPINLGSLIRRGLLSGVKNFNSAITMEAAKKSHEV